MTTDRRNFLPSDEHRDRLNDLFEEAQNWLDGSEIKTEAEAEGIETLLKLTREAEAAADADRVIEKAPHDLAAKAVQARYKPIMDRADTIKAGCKAVLTKWRDKLQLEQERKAAEQRRIAEEAAAEAARVAQVAQGDVGAMEVAKGAMEIAQRLAKTATRMEKAVGVGLRMRTTRHGAIFDLKVVIAHYYRTKQDWMIEMIGERIAADLQRGETKIPGVEITETKESY